MLSGRSAVGERHCQFDTTPSDYVALYELRFYRARCLSFRYRAATGAGLSSWRDTPKRHGASRPTIRARMG